jgi:hypothetical protein
MATIVAASQLTVTDQNDSAAMVLSRDIISIPVENDGSGGVFSGTNTVTATIMLGSTDDTANWKFTVTRDSNLNITESTSSTIQTVTGITGIISTLTYNIIFSATKGGDTISKICTVQKSLKGTTGANGTRTAILDMYMVAADSTTPSVYPSGTSTYDWEEGTFNSPDIDAHGWQTVPATPGTNQSLYIARTMYTDTSTSLTSPVIWPEICSVRKASAAGANGQNTAYLEVYQWSITKPTVFPSGTSDYTWSNGTFTPPTTANGWAVMPGALVAGGTLYACSIRKVTTVVEPVTYNISWTANDCYVIGSAGIDGKKYRIEIESTSGTIFRVGQARSTTLKAHVYENDTEITDTLNALQFKWRRVSEISDPSGDIAWNAIYQSGYKQITITIDNVNKLATFSCDITQ